MTDGTIPPELHEKYLKIILFETERLTDLTHDLLTLNEFDTNHLLLNREVFDIHEMIKHVAASFEGVCTQKKISIELVFATKHLNVNADKRKIQQVLYNLLDNAIEGCRSAAGEKFLRLSLRMKGDMLYFYLLNSAGKKQKKVGSLFRTGKTGAHGFGLHRAEAIVKQHGGWVKYNSEDGAFTSEFLVPAAC